jgi:Ras-related protein Rab-32
VGGVNKLFCREALGALVVADISNRESIEATLSWKEQVDMHVALKNGEPIPMILVVNKFDLVENIAEEELEEQMTQEFLNEFADQNGFVGALRVSAKTGLNVN